MNICRMCGKDLEQNERHGQIECLQEEVRALKEQSRLDHVRLRMLTEQVCCMVTNRESEASLRREWKGEL